MLEGGAGVKQDLVGVLLPHLSVHVGQHLVRADPERVASGACAHGLFEPARGFLETVVFVGDVAQRDAGGCRRSELERLLGQRLSRLELAAPEPDVGQIRQGLGPVGVRRVADDLGQELFCLGQPVTLGQRERGLVLRERAVLGRRDLQRLAERLGRFVLPAEGAERLAGRERNAVRRFAGAVVERGSFAQELQREVRIVELEVSAPQ